jgi:hypothetical protein
MSVPERFDFSRLFEGSGDAEIMPAKQVPVRLRELADQLTPSKKPRLVLEEPRLVLSEVYSLQAITEGRFANTSMTLVLRVGNFFGPVPQEEEGFDNGEHRVRTVAFSAPYWAT